MTGTRTQEAYGRDGGGDPQGNGGRREVATGGEEIGRSPEVGRRLVLGEMGGSTGWPGSEDDRPSQ